MYPKIYSETEVRKIWSTMLKNCQQPDGANTNSMGFDDFSKIFGNGNKQGPSSKEYVEVKILAVKT